MNEHDLINKDFYINIILQSKAYFDFLQEFVDRQLQKSANRELRLIKSELIRYRNSESDKDSNHVIAFDSNEQSEYEIELLECLPTIQSLFESGCRPTVKGWFPTLCAQSAFVTVPVAALGPFIGAPTIMLTGCTYAIYGAGAGMWGTIIKDHLFPSKPEAELLKKLETVVLNNIAINCLIKPDDRFENKICYTTKAGITAKIKINFFSLPPNAQNLRLLTERILQISNLLDANRVKIQHLEMPTLNMLIHILQQLKVIGNLYAEIKLSFADELKQFIYFNTNDPRARYIDFILPNGELDKVIVFHQQRQALVEARQELTDTKRLYGLFTSRHESRLVNGLAKITACLVQLKSASNNKLNDVTQPMLVKEKNYLFSLLYKSSSLLETSAAECCDKYGDKYVKQVLLDTIAVMNHIISMWLKNIDDTAVDCTVLKAELEQYLEIVTTLYDEMKTYPSDTIKEKKQSILDSLKCFDLLLDKAARYRTGSKTNDDFFKNYLKEIIEFIRVEVLRMEAYQAQIQSVITKSK